MRHATAFLFAAALMLPAIAAAQIKTVPGEPVTVKATITAIDHSTRMMTLKAADGTSTSITVPTEVKRFNELKTGDVITAKYQDTIVLRLMKPGEAAVNSATSGLAAGSGARPSGTATVQRSITATITAIDPTVPSITLTGPDKKVYTEKVADKEALKMVKVGDRLDITWSAAVLVSAESPTPK
jgi:hypothetical protein